MSPAVFAAALLSLTPLTDPLSARLAGDLAKVVGTAKVRTHKFYAEYGPRHEAVKSDADRAELERWAYAAHLEVTTADRADSEALMVLLRTSATDPAAVPGLLHAAMGAGDATRAEAGGLVRRHHLSHPRVIAVAEGPWGLAGEEWVEPLIRDLLGDGAAPADHLPRLRFSLAKHLKDKAELPAKIAGTDPRAAKYSAEQTARIAKLDVAKLEAEALELFDGVVAAGAKEEYTPGVTIAEASHSAAYEIRNLSVGKTAPEIAGEDLDGVPLKLSDSRGKVVVLTFWARKCGPCLEFAERERKLAAQFAGRPFAAVGVNVDPDRDAAKKVADGQKFAGRSFWAGPKGNAGPIPQTWNVTGWPTIYVLDHAGVIRSKNVRGRELDRLLETFVSKAEADAGK